MTFEDLRSKTRTQIVKKFEPISVSQRVEWHNKGPDKDSGINDSVNICANKIEAYIEKQIKAFLKDNKISEKNWQKRGVIQCLPPDLGSLSFVLYYKSWRKELKTKITIGYDFIINN